MIRLGKHGFSLIELVVALAILAAITTVALRATTNLQTQARYQQTTRSLNDIRDAIIGPANQRNPDGSTLVTGFVADTGRLPQFYISGSDPLGTSGDPLNELISNPNSIPAYQFYSSNVDSSVRIGVGWQGPYLHLGAGPTFIRDGWGNSFHGYDGSGNPISTAGTQIAQIASWGVDNQADVNHQGSVSIANNYNDDTSIPNPTITSSTASLASAATITGQVTMNLGTDIVSGVPLGSGPTPNLTFTGTPITPSSSSVSSVPVSIWVSYIGPDLTHSPNPVADDPVLVDYDNGGMSGTPNSGAWNTPWTGQFLISSPTYTNVTIGPRVLKVYVLPATVVTPSGGNLTDFNYYVQNANTTNPIYAVTALNVTLVGGSQTINLTLPHFSP